MRRFADDMSNWEPDPPSRDGRLTLGLNKDQDRILEIGPSVSPLASKRDNWCVWTIDHATREGLIEKYTAHENVDTSVIEDVDFVWKQGTIAESIPPSFHGTFDACLASHVIEHIPDFIGFFQSLAKVLKDEGTVSMAVPDKRYCFDYFRPHSTTGATLAAHFARASRHDAASLFDFVSYCSNNDGDIAWSQTPPGDLQLLHGIDAFDLGQFEQLSEHYQDCHGWLYTPSSFALLILELSALKFIDFGVRYLYESAGCEFIVHLQKGRRSYKSAEDLQSARLELLKQTIIELGEQNDLLKQSMFPRSVVQRLGDRLKAAAKRALRVFSA